MMLGHARAGDGHHGQQVLQADEVSGAGGEERELLGHPAEDPGGLGVEGNRVEFVLGALEHIQPACALSVLVVVILLVASPYLVRPGRQLSQSDDGDRHLGRKLGGIDPPAQDQDVGVEQALPGRLRCRVRASPRIGIAVLVVGGRVLVGAEAVQVASWRVA